MLDHGAAQRLADAWWTNVREHCPPPHSQRCQRRLPVLVTELAAALRAEPFTTTPAVRVGSELVRLHLTDPVVLTRTAAVLADLPAWVGDQRWNERSRIDTAGHIRIAALIGALGQGFAQALMQRTATEHRQRHDELYWQARHDPLTQLPNRLYLREALDAAIATSGPTGRVGMCFLDLDSFKAVNDRHGHGVGDRLLTAIAARLRDAAPDKISLIARLGGDEFVALIIPPVRQERVVAVSQALLDAVRHPVDIGGHTFTISASIGALSTRIGNHDADTLLAAADAGLYRAKADTRERIAVQFNPSQELPALNRKLLA